MSTAAPVERSTATAQSRSQLEPGKTTTAAFTLGDLHAIAFDDGVGEEPLAHRLDLGLGGPSVGAGKVELDGLADADVVYAPEAQAVQGAFDSLARTSRTP